MWPNLTRKAILAKNPCHNLFYEILKLFFKFFLDRSSA